MKESSIRSDDPVNLSALSETQEDMDGRLALSRLAGGPARCWTGRKVRFEMDLGGLTSYAVRRQEMLGRDTSERHS